MNYNSQKHHRRSIRLKDYDYSQPGVYFVTICSWNRECLFGEIVDGEMRLNEYGMILQKEWLKSSEIRKEIELDEFVIMPNHFHGIVCINVTGNIKFPVGANGRSPLRMKPKSLSSFMAGFKSSVTKQINQIRNHPGLPVWQRNYYERVVRNEMELFKIREYIQNNPMQWDIDGDNPKNL